MNTRFLRAMRPYFTADSGANGTGDGTASQVGDGQTTATTTQTTTQAQGQGTQSQTTATPDPREKEIAELRRESASYRTKLKAFEEAQKAAEDAKLDELTRAQKRAQELEAAHTTATQQLQAMRVQMAVMSAASRMGIIDPDAAVRLLDTGDIEFDAAGNPKHIDKLLTALLEARPYLKAPEPATPGKPVAPNLGSTNAARASVGNGGTVSVTANQYLDPGFQAEFQKTYGMPILQGVNKGIVKITG